MSSTIGISSIWQEDERKLGITWSDGLDSFFDVVGLRRACPCAHCVDEITGQRTLEPGKVPETTRPVKIHSIGRYAMAIDFSDGHKTGIYTFDYLRQLAFGARTPERESPL